MFLDADTLILQNSDELFEREEFSAAPDAGWPDCFNSGVFVFRPNLNTFKVIVKTRLWDAGMGDGTSEHQGPFRQFMQLSTALLFILYYRIL